MDAYDSEREQQDHGHQDRPEHQDHQDHQDRGERAALGRDAHGGHGQGLGHEHGHSTQAHRLFRAAATGRADVVGTAGMGLLQRTVGNSALGPLIQRARSASPSSAGAEQEEAPAQGHAGVAAARRVPRVQRGGGAPGGVRRVQQPLLGTGEGRGRRRAVSGGGLRAAGADDEDRGVLGDVGAQGRVPHAGPPGPDHRRTDLAGRGEAGRYGCATRRASRPSTYGDRGRYGRGSRSTRRTGRGRTGGRRWRRWSSSGGGSERPDRTRPSCRSGPRGLAGSGPRAG